MANNDTFQFLVAIITVALALAGLIIVIVVAVLATWRQHSDTRCTHRATVEALSRIEEIVRSWALSGPAPSMAKAPLPPLEGAPNDSEALRSLLPLLSELDESFSKLSERTAYSGQVAASLASSEAALRALEESTERINQGLRDFTGQVGAGTSENYNRPSS